MAVIDISPTQFVIEFKGDYSDDDDGDDDDVAVANPSKQKEEKLDNVMADFMAV